MDENKDSFTFSSLRWVEFAGRGSWLDAWSDMPELNVVDIPFRSIPKRNVISYSSSVGSFQWTCRCWRVVILYSGILYSLFKQLRIKLQSRLFSSFHNHTANVNPKWSVYIYNPVIPLTLPLLRESWNYTDASPSLPLKRKTRLSQLNQSMQTTILKNQQRIRFYPPHGRAKAQ